MTHYKEECVHGKVGLQCRCPGPKSVNIVSCKSVECPRAVVSPEQIKEIAEQIILSEVEDVEFLSVWEIMENRLRGNPYFDMLSNENQHALALKIDEMIRSASISIEFPEESNATS